MGADCTSWKFLGTLWIWLLCSSGLIQLISPLRWINEFCSLIVFSSFEFLIQFLLLNGVIFVGCRAVGDIAHTYGGIWHHSPDFLTSNLYVFRCTFSGVYFLAVMENIRYNATVQIIAWPCLRPLVRITIADQSTTHVTHCSCCGISRICLDCWCFIVFCYQIVPQQALTIHVAE